MDTALKTVRENTMNMYLIFYSGNIIHSIIISLLFQLSNTYISVLYYLEPVTENEVSAKVNSLKKSSLGWDDISCKVIKKHIKALLNH